MMATGSSPRAGGLAGRARAFLAGTVLAAVACFVPAFAGFGVGRDDLLRFALLGAAAAIAHLCVIETGRNHGFPTALVFLLAGVMLLPPELVALLALAQHGPELVQRRYPWYIATFNVSNYTLNLLGAFGAARLVSSTFGLHGDDRFALAGFAACVVFVALNHFLLAAMLRLARGHSFRTSRLFTVESLSIDLVLAALGLALAAFARTNPALVPAAILPIVAVHRLLDLMASREARRPTTALRAQEAS